MTAVAKLMEAKLAGSGLTRTDGAKLRMKALTGEQVRKLNPQFHSVGAMHIPYFDALGKPTSFYRLRYLEDLSGFAGNAKKTQRYVQAAGTVNEVYLPPLLKGAWATVLTDPAVPLYITEGELKAACAAARGLPAVGLGGVDVWRSAKHQMPLLPLLETVVWKGRRVLVVFDSDAASNVDVMRAEAQLAKALVDRGAVVGVARLPPAKDGKKQGLDDYLVAHGVKAFAAVVAEAEAPDEGCSALHTMNDEVVWVREPGLVVVRETGQRLSYTNFVGAHYANRKHVEFGGDKPKHVSTAKVWMEWPARAEVRRLTYQPGAGGVVDGQWNTWTGWGVQPKRGDVGPWRRLLDFLFKHEPPAVRQWFERWCAYPLQHPGTKLFTSVAMWGVAQGTGKSLVGYTLRDIYGRNGIEIKNHHLTAGFNEWAENKQFVMGDEVTGGDKRVDADHLKGLITQEETVINAKFLPTYSLPDCINYYFTSNHPDAFFLEDTDRRFFIHEVHGVPETKEFYAAYDKWRRADGPAHLFDHLLRLSMGDWHPTAPAMATQAKDEMLDSSRSDLGAWCRALLAEPALYLRPLGENTAKRGDLFTNAQLLRCYQPEGGRVTAGGLGRELARAGARRIPPVATSIGTQRLYAVRNAAQWEKARPKACADHWDGLFGPGARKF